MSFTSSRLEVCHPALDEDSFSEWFAGGTVGESLRLGGCQTGTCRRYPQRTTLLPAQILNWMRARRLLRAR
jgi:hypothetical protein